MSPTMRSKVDDILRDYVIVLTCLVRGSGNG